jgi:EF-hand domain-containing protein 1
MREGKPLGLTGSMGRPKLENDSIPRIAPQWLKYDRQVLRFFGYFQESVIENKNENF